MSKIYSFENASFDADRGELMRAGEVGCLRPQTAAVLAYLLERPRQVVSKEELLREVWADLVVTENSLVQCVREIRRALADDTGVLVRTVQRRGYSLEADVSQGPAPDPSAGLAGHGKRISIVVMPLVNVDRDPEQEYFAEGLTEDLTTDLGRIPGALVIARGTAYSYRGRPMDVRQVGRELGVRYVVEGSVRRRGDDVVVNLGLSETERASQLWAERFEGRRAELASLQRSMAGRIAQVLAVELFDAESERVGRDAHYNPDAQELAMRAWSFWQRARPETNAQAKRLARQALGIDANCILAWVVLAQACITDVILRLGDNLGESLNEAEKAATTAMALDPGHALVNHPFGVVLAFRGRFEEALGVFEAQMQLNPNLPLTHAWTGITHILMGNPLLAIPSLEQAIRLNPRSPAISTTYRNIAVAHLHAGQDEQALIFAERSIRLPNPWARSYETLAAVYATAGLLEDARAAVRVLLERWPGYSIAKHREEMISSRPAFLAQRERYINGLRLAGLPEA